MYTNDCHKSFCMIALLCGISLGSSAGKKKPCSLGNWKKNCRRKWICWYNYAIRLEHIWSVNENRRGKPQQCCWFKGIEIKDQTSWVRLLQPQEAGLALEGAGDRALQTLLVSHDWGKKMLYSCKVGWGENRFLWHKSALTLVLVHITCRCAQHPQFGSKVTPDCGAAPSAWSSG